MKIMVLPSCCFWPLSLLFLCFFAKTAAAQSPDYQAQARVLIAQMTLEEKAGLCSGRDFWSTKPVERLGVPSIFMTDGPHGLRKASGSDISQSVPATCFPTASGLASTWNRDLLREVGAAIGAECQANDVQILLGPGINMKRSPLGGRNFEYFSEDPVLAGHLGTAFIQGVQSQGVGTSLKHFAANNQEFERMSMTSNVDERALHEIYFPAFEMAVKEAQPWTIMCAYNQLNGVYCAENEWLLDQVLRRDWGFKGIVVSDWGAVNDRPLGIQAGLNLEMPGNGGFNDRQILAAVHSGRLSEARLDEMATEVLALVLRAKAAHRPNVKFDVQQHHELARKASGEAIVLLKNQDGVLPINPAHSKKIAILGAFAKTPRFQGAGSSVINATQVSNAYDEMSRLLGKQALLSYAPGYALEASTSEAMLAEARRQAKAADVAVVFIGLPDSYESEGYDRSNLDLPAAHNQLVEAVASVQPNVVVVLLNGSAVAMPWTARVKGILEGWLGGQAGGGALADVLLGKINPSGKISETFPARLEDTPTFLDFPGKNGVANYAEGLFIGYRYYDKKKIEPLFPFGYGLSYTNFTYSTLNTSAASIRADEPLTVELTVKNTGKVSGKEVVQLYVHDRGTEVSRPERELKHFEKVELQPGESKTLRFTLSYRDFAYYNAEAHDWLVNSGSFDILVGGSSRDLPLQKTVQVTSTKPWQVEFTRTTLIKEFAKNPKGKAFYAKALAAMHGDYDPAQHPEDSPAQQAMKMKSSRFAQAIVNELPAYKIVLLTRGNISEAEVEALIKAVNEKGQP